MIKRIGYLLAAVFCVSTIYSAALANVADVGSVTKSVSTAEAVKTLEIKKEKNITKPVKKAAPKAAKHHKHRLTVASPAAKQPPATMPVLAPASSYAPAGGPQQPENPGPAPSSMGR